jgi:hypothetical protein
MGFICPETCSFQSDLLGLLQQQEFPSKKYECSLLSVAELYRGSKRAVPDAFFSIWYESKIAASLRWEL